MCGYVCVGCGMCGRKSLYGHTLLCISCGTENKKGRENCVSCGYRFAPGPGSKTKANISKQLPSLETPRSQTQSIRH